MNGGDLVRLGTRWNVWVIESVNIEDDPRKSNVVLSWQGISFTMPILIFDECLNNRTLICYSKPK